MIEAAKRLCNYVYIYISFGLMVPNDQSHFLLRMHWGMLQERVSARVECEGALRKLPGFHLPKSQGHHSLSKP